MSICNYYEQLNAQTGIKAYLKKKLFKNLLEILVEQEQKVLVQEGRLQEQEGRLQEQERWLQEQERWLQEQEKRLQVQERRFQEQMEKMGCWQVLPKVMENDGILEKQELLQGLGRDAYKQNKDVFYFNLSNAFRGPEKEIYSTVKMFFSYIKNAASKNPTLPFVDIGCGRGEFLDVLREHNISCLGIDMNQVSAQKAIENGHKIIIGDAISYLQHQDEKSVSGVSMIMVSEHIEFSVLFDAIFLFGKVIADGGPLLINTINSYCFERYGNFNLDPSHINYLPPDTYKLIMEMAGFKNIKVIWSEPIRKYIAGQPLHTQYEDVTLVGYKD